MAMLSLLPFVANALRGVFPLLDLLVICLVQAMVAFCCNDDGWKRCVHFSLSHGGFFRFASPARAR
jgi:hypothetical protein